MHRVGTADNYGLDVEHIKLGGLGDAESLLQHAALSRIGIDLSKGLCLAELRPALMRNFANSRNQLMLRDCSRALGNDLRADTRNAAVFHDALKSFAGAHIGFL